MSQYGDPTYVPHSMVGPRYIAVAGIGFIWFGVTERGVGVVEPDLPTPCPGIADPHTTREVKDSTGAVISRFLRLLQFLNNQHKKMATSAVRTGRLYP